jgi:hypothetical protein
MRTAGLLAAVGITLWLAYLVPLFVLIGVSTGIFLSWKEAKDATSRVNRRADPFCSTLVSDVKSEPFGRTRCVELAGRTRLTHVGVLFTA